MITIIIPTVGTGKVKEQSSRALSDSIRDCDDVVVREVGQKEAGSWGDAINVGLDGMLGGDAVIMDDDVIVDPGWLDAFRSALNSDFVKKSGKRLGIIGSRLRFPDGRIQHAGCALQAHLKGEYCVDQYSVEQVVGAGVVHLGHGRADKPSKFSEPLWCPHVTFSLCYLTSDVIKAVGKVDSEYFVGVQYEDIDYSFRALEMGFSVLYWPGVTAVHHQTHSKSNLHGGSLNEKTKINEELMNGRWFRHPAKLREIGVLP